MSKLQTQFKMNAATSRLLSGDLHLSLVRSSSVLVAKEWKRLAIKNASAGTGKSTLSRRSGGLIQSIRYRSEKTNKGLNIRLEFADYGAIHETGAVITPKKKKYLTFYIPGVGWRRSKRIVIPQRPWATSALNQARKQFPEFVQKELAREILRSRTVEVNSDD